MNTVLRRRQGGLSYIEILITVLVVALLAGPAAEALRIALRTSDAVVQERRWRLEVRGALENALALEYDALAGRTGVEATLDTADGERIAWTVARYDIDNADGDNNQDTGADDGVRLVSAWLVGTSIRYETLAIDR